MLSGKQVDKLYEHLSESGQEGLEVELVFADKFDNHQAGVMLRALERHKAIKPKEGTFEEVKGGRLRAHMFYNSHRSLFRVLAESLKDVEIIKG